MSKGLNTLSNKNHPWIRTGTHKPKSRDKLMGEVLFRHCAQCGEWKILNFDNFYRNKLDYRGASALCKDCHKLAVKKSRGKKKVNQDDKTT